MTAMHLYRGVNSELYRKTAGQLLPKALGEPFNRAVYYGEQAYYGSGATYGASAANAVIMHQQNSSDYPTCGVSTTPILERAICYANHEGKYAAGFVYKIGTSLLAQFVVVAYNIAEYATKPHCPDDREVILVSADGGPLPAGIIVDVIRV